jgi:hypothetical protein
MPKRWCSDCRRLFDMDSTGTLRCPACQAIATAKRNAQPSSTSRGYDAEYERNRPAVVARASGTPSKWVDAPGVGIIVETRHFEDAVHIARHDPARVLREVTAKRAVLAWYEDSLDASATFKEKLGTGTHMATAAESYLNVIRGHAAAWSDHPDYQREWAR